MWVFLCLFVYGFFLLSFCLCLHGLLMLISREVGLRCPWVHSFTVGRTNMAPWFQVSLDFRLQMKAPVTSTAGILWRKVLLTVLLNRVRLSVFEWTEQA